MAADAPELNNAPIKCPETSWVHDSLMDEYKQMKANPSSKMTLEMHAWRSDFYNLELDGKKMRVSVEEGKDPKKPEDVFALGKDLNEELHRPISDIYRDNRRIKAGFNIEDPKTHDTLANGVAVLDSNGRVRSMTGGTYDSAGEYVFFDAHFDENGTRTEVGTIKDMSRKYTPIECK